MVVFGASGDLCTRKLLPALRALASRAELPGGFSLVGVARTVFDDDQSRVIRGRADPRRERPGHERLVSAAGSSVRLVIRSGPWAAG